MNKEEMKQRTKQFALQIIKLFANLPKGRILDVLGRQLLRAGTSVGANY
jgi:four helix bundle protein